MIKRLINKLALAASMLLTRFDTSLGGLTGAANTYGYDAAVEQHEKSVRRTLDNPIASRWTLVKKGAADNTVDICTATDDPIGVVDNTALATEGVTVLLLGKGLTKKCIANAAITVGAKVYAAALGYVDVVGRKYVGTALTPAANQGDIIEVWDCPIPNVPTTPTAFNVIAAGQHPWAGGAAKTDTIIIAGLLTTDIVIANVGAAAATEALQFANTSAGQINLGLTANGTNVTTVVNYSVLRAV